MTANEWESAWSDYVDALDWYDADHSGPNFILDIAHAAERLRRATRRLVCLSPDFCERLGIR